MQEQYRHEAVPYHGQDAFLSCCSAVADRALNHDEQLMFVMSAAKVDALQARLGGDLDDITYLDADEQVRNPARLLTLFDSFRSGGRHRRCVGVHEPAVAGTSATLAETRFAESVLNSPALQSWNLAVLCMYDATGLDEAARTEMRRSHPSVRGEDGNPAYQPDRAGALFAEPLPAPPPHARGHEVHDRHLVPVRDFVRRNAGELAPDRREDLVLAADEIITNSVKHGGGHCRVAMWHENGSVVCDVQDAGHITDPLVGRLAPKADATAGRGLWLANHLCDLVQIRSSQAGTTVRLRIDT
jgi:anti-sigma regulatory factor (Ser/Thr protein kinase)